MRAAFFEARTAPVLSPTFFAAAGAEYIDRVFLTEVLPAARFVAAAFFTGRPTFSLCLSDPLAPFSEIFERFFGGLPGPRFPAVVRARGAAERRCPFRETLRALPRSRLSAAGGGG